MPQRHRTTTRVREHQHTDDQRIQHELKEMRETHDLRDIDDDVEDIATLMEWHALEHNHQPKSPRWFMILAGITAVLVVFFLFTANFIGAITTTLVGGLLYFLSQRKPETLRYRIMVDGVAMHNTLYHYRDLEAFNVIYEPGQTKTVLLRSQRRLAPLIHMEIGDADPVAIRDVLLQFLPEDQEMDEPLVDVLARRAGF